MTDSSDFGTGGVLIQVDDDGGYRQVAFTSRKLMSAGVRFTTAEKECLAVVYATKK